MRKPNLDDRRHELWNRPATRSNPNLHRKPQPFQDQRDAPARREPSRRRRPAHKENVMVV
jgi:hypothetical protein